MTLNNEMFDGVAGSESTSLTTAYSIGDSVIVVADATVLPSPNNILTIINSDNDFVTIRYTSIVGNQISGLTVKSQGTATIFAIGSVVSRNYCYTDDYAIKHNISDLDSAKVDKYQGETYSGKYLKVGSDGYIMLASGGGGGGGGGVTDYNDLDNLPRVNSVMLIGNKTGAQLGLVDAETGKGLSTNDYTNTDKNTVAGLPTQISALTILVSSKVDKVAGSSLVPDSKVTAYDTHIADSTIHVTTSDKTTWNAKQDALTFDDVPTAGSSNPVKSSGIKSELDGKVETYQGASKVGYYLVVDSDGNVTSEQLPRPYVLGEMLMYPPLSEARMLNKILIT